MRPELRYDYRVRSYDSDERCDYTESMFTLYVWPDLFKPLQLAGLLQSRRRHYSGTFVDSLLNNHFQEFYGQVDSKWSIHPAWLLRTELEFNLRRYEYPAIATPHYYDVLVEPSLAWQATAALSIRTGYRWRQKRHWFSQSGDDWNAEMENFSGHGPVFGCDVLSIKGLYITLLEHFEWRRYPQAPASGFCL